MAKQLILAIPYSNSDLGTVVMLGRRRIIQRRRDGKKLQNPMIPHWGGQVTPIGGSAADSVPLYDAISAMFTAQTGLDLPVRKDAASFTPIQTARGLTAYVLPLEVGEGELTAMIRATNSAIAGLTVDDGLFEEMLPASVFALDELLGQTPVPEGGWNRFMYRAYFQDYLPGPMDRLPPIILDRLTRFTQEDSSVFLRAIETLPETPVSVTLTGINVIGATQDAATGTYLAPFQHDGLVQLDALVSSGDPLAAGLVAWEIDGKDAGTGARLTLTTGELTAQGAPIVVIARLGSSRQQVTLAVRPDFERFWIDGAAEVEVLDNDQRLRASARYGADAPPVVVHLQLRPSTPAAYDQVTWTGGTRVPGEGNDRRAVSRRAVTRKGQPVKVTARLNPVFEADVEVLPVLDRVLADGQPVGENGLVEMPYGTDPNYRLVLRAVTSPDNEDAWTHLQWTGGEAGATANLRIVPLTGVRPDAGPITVTVGIGPDATRTIRVQVRPRLAAIEPVAWAETTGAGTARGYRGDGPPAVVRLRLDPPDAAADPAVQWSNNVEAWRSPATRALSRALPNDTTVTITARSAGQEVRLDLSLVAPAQPVGLALAPERITFLNTTALNDDQDNLIDQIWTSGAASPPESFPGGTTIRLTAEFRLTTRPPEDRSVVLRGTSWVPLAGGGATLLRWTSAPIAVAAAGPTPATLTMADVHATAPLAGEVSYQLRANAGAALAQQRWPVEILWEMRPEAGGAWSQIGTSRHPTYVMLGAPAANCAHFRTSFDIACRAADGATAAPLTLARTYGAFEARDPATGANAALHRTSDQRALTYWLNDAPAQTLAGMLANARANGSCRAFAELLQDMLRAHGIAADGRVEVVPNEAVSAEATAFAVATWQFNPPTSPATFDSWPYTWDNTGNQHTAHWASGPGQNKAQPPAGFLNHFIVRHGGAFYDPSYGTAAQPDFDSWSRVSIAALMRDALPDVGYAGPPQPPVAAVTRLN